MVLVTKRGNKYKRGLFACRFLISYQMSYVIAPIFQKIL